MLEGSKKQCFHIFLLLQCIIWTVFKGPPEWHLLLNYVIIIHDFQNLNKVNDPSDKKHVICTIHIYLSLLFEMVLFLFSSCLKEVIPLPGNVMLLNPAHVDVFHWIYFKTVDEKKPLLWKGFDIKKVWIPSFIRRIC